LDFGGFGKTTGQRAKIDWQITKITKQGKKWIILAFKGFGWGYFFWDFLARRFSTPLGNSRILPLRQGIPSDPRRLETASLPLVPTPSNHPSHLVKGDKIANPHNTLQ
jgi:hypothetical protein